MMKIESNKSKKPSVLSTSLRGMKKAFFYVYFKSMNNTPCFTFFRNLLSILIFLFPLPGQVGGDSYNIRSLRWCRQSVQESKGLQSEEY